MYGWFHKQNNNVAKSYIYLNKSKRTYEEKSPNQENLTKILHKLFLKQINDQGRKSPNQLKGSDSENPLSEIKTFVKHLICIKPFKPKGKNAEKSRSKKLFQISQLNLTP